MDFTKAIFFLRNILLHIMKQNTDFSFQKRRNNDKTWFDNFWIKSNLVKIICECNQNFNFLLNY